MLAIIGGTSLLETSLFHNMEEQIIRTPYGDAAAFVKDNLVYIQRHGKEGNTPPHTINYKANLTAIHQLDVTKTIAINSTGSLKEEIKPGTLVVPDDYFNLFDVPTFFDNQLKFTVPGLDPKVRSSIISIAQRHHIEIIPQGVYFQVHGPILETQAEIRFIKQIGDIVGMTMAKEAILAKEIQLSYASICMIDNYANGITQKPLTLHGIDRTRNLNLNKLEELLGHICREMVND